MIRKRFAGTALLAAALLLCLAAGAAAQEPTVRVTHHPEYGPILTYPDGMTLYLFTVDDPNVTNCYDGCAIIWPPLRSDSEPVAPPGLSGELGLIPRNDGGMQVTYNGWPLYGWIEDSEPGDVLGHGVNDVWWVVHPAPTVAVSAEGYLVGGDGMTLYTFANDTPGVSNCYGNCARNWPPLRIAFGEIEAPPELAGRLGLIERTDGHKQVTLDGWPLYYWVGDTEPGHTTGDTIPNWDLARP